MLAIITHINHLYQPLASPFINLYKEAQFVPLATLSKK
jgi:hypothetical protein